MSAYDDLLKQIDRVREQVIELQCDGDFLGVYPKKEEFKFIPGEMVQCRDSDSYEWRIGKYISGKEGEFKHLVIAIASETFPVGWRQCRVPKDIPGIFIRHVGNERPVTNGDATVLVYFLDGECNTSEASSFAWLQNGESDGIVGYMILPDWVGREDE